MLKRLHVTNLGPIKEAVLDDRAPVTLLLGRNESGKTTLLEALHVLYFGTRGGVPVGENKALTRDGAKGWGINAVVNDGVGLDATRSNRPLQEDCRRVLGDPRVFRSLTFARYFLGMVPEERKALLADLHATDTDDLYERLEGLKAPASVLVAVGAGNMKKAHTEAVEARRTAGRLLKGAEADRDAEVLDPEVETKQGTLAVSKLPLDMIEGSIQRLRTRRDGIVKAVAARAQHSAVSAAGEKARADLDALEAEVSFGTGDRNRLTTLDDDLADLQRKSQVATAQIAAASQEDLKLKALVKQLSPGEQIDCPTCTRPITEEEANAMLRAVSASTAERMGNAKAEQTAHAVASKPLYAERKELQDRRMEAEKAGHYRRRLQEQVDAADNADVPDEPKQTSVDLDGEIGRVTKMRDLRRDYDLALRSRAAGEVKAKAAQGKVDEMKRIEVLCDPAAMANEEDALAQLNALLKRTTGKLGALVEVDSAFRVTVQGRSPGLAADSIIVRAGFGVGCALSVISGVGLALLDRFESLDATARKQALGMVKGLVDDGLLSTVLIAAVKDEPVRGADVPWLAWVKVSDGTVEYL